MSSGILLGRDDNQNPVYVSIDPHCPNIFISGSIGTGKTVTAKSMIVKALVMGTAIIVLDRTGEYSRMSKMLGGVCIKPDEVFLNPFDLSQEPIIDMAAKQADLVRLIASVVNHKISDIGLALLQEVIQLEYEAVGIQKDFCLQPEIKAPTIPGLINRLREIKATDLANVLSGAFKNVNLVKGQTTFELIDTPVTVFDLSTEKDVPGNMACILYWLWDNFAKSQPGDKLLVIDSLLPKPEWLFHQYLSIGRSYNTSTIIATQSPWDFEFLLCHFDMRILMRHNDPGFSDKLLAGTDFHPDQLTQLGRGQCLASSQEGTQLVNIEVPDLAWSTYSFRNLKYAR